MNREKLKKLYPVWEVICTIALVIFYGYFAFVFLNKFLSDRSFSALLFLIYEMILVILIVIRNWPAKISSSLYDWAVALCGTLLPLLMRPVEFPQENALLLGLQLAGMMVSMVGLVSLFKSYGTVAANRGIRTSGMYKFIRHPLYAGYFVSIYCFIVMNPSPRNIGLIVVFTAIQVMRIFAEEKLLKQDPLYQEYAARVKWRILPFVW